MKITHREWATDLRTNPWLYLSFFPDHKLKLNVTLRGSFFTFYSSQSILLFNHTRLRLSAFPWSKECTRRTLSPRRTPVYVLEQPCVCRYTLFGPRCAGSVLYAAAAGVFRCVELPLIRLTFKPWRSSCCETQWHTHTVTSVLAALFVNLPHGGWALFSLVASWRWCKSDRSLLGY